MKKLIYLFCLSFLLISCGSDDSNDNEDQDPQGSFVSATIDGENFLANSTTILLPITGQLIENDVFFSFQVSATIQDGRSLVIGFSGLDFNMVIDGVEADADEGDFDLLAKGLYAESDSEFGDLANGESDGDAYVKITSIDKVNQVVSGEFHYIAIGDDDITYNITEGIFNNISYTIL